MLRHAPIGFLAFPLALLTACGGGGDTAATDEETATPPAVVEAAPAAPISYDCLPAHLLTVAYDNSGVAPTAALSLDGANFLLSRIESASGAKYKTDTGRTPDKTLIWWTQGENGMLVEGPVGGPESAEVTLAECSPSDAAG